MLNKFKFLAIITALLIAGSTLWADTDDNNIGSSDNAFYNRFFVGARGGYANSGWDHDGYSSKGFGFALLGGYVINRYFAIDGRFTHLPTSTKSGKDNIKTNSVSINLSASLQLKPKWHVFSTFGLGSTFQSGGASHSHFGPILGIGTNYQLNHNTTIEAEFRHFVGRYGSSQVPNASFVSIGFDYLLPASLFGK